MKTNIFFLILFTFLIGNRIDAQCSRSGNFIAADPNVYPVSGGANITFMTDGSKMVNFESNFATVQGLNLEVFLSPTSSYDPATVLQISTQPLQDDNGGMDTNDAITGVKSFVVPANVELADYDNVLIVCTQINALWGHASLGQNVGADCVTLSVNTVDFSSNIKLYPNPATGTVSVSNNTSQELSIDIFNVLGERVFTSASELFTQRDINLSSFDSGIYLVNVSNDKKSITKKLVVR